MKVQANFHLLQTVGNLQVERVIGTLFDLEEDDAITAAAAGIVKIIEAKSPKPANAHNRKTRVVNHMETK